MCQGRPTFCWLHVYHTHDAAGCLIGSALLFRLPRVILFCTIIMHDKLYSTLSFLL